MANQANLHILTVLVYKETCIFSKILMVPVVMKTASSKNNMQDVPKKLPAFNLKYLRKYWAKKLSLDVFGLLK